MCSFVNTVSIHFQYYVYKHFMNDKIKWKMRVNHSTLFFLQNLQNQKLHYISQTNASRVLEVA